MNFLFRNSLLIFVVFWGISLSITQTVLFREYLCVAEGNEISIGLMLSLWLLFNSIGALLWVFKKRVVSSKLYLFPILGFLLSIFTIVFLRYVNIILNIPQGTTADLKTIFFIGLLSVSLPAIISGSSFPFLCAQPDLSERKESVALVYGCESLGLVIGYLLTIIAIGIKVSHIGLITFSYGLSLIYLLILKRHKFKELLLAVVVLFTSLPIMHYIDGFTLQNSFLYRNKGYEFISYVDTNYNRYVLAKRSEQYALFVNNRFSRLIGDDYNSKIISHLTMSVLENPKDVLVVGEASFDMLKHIREHNVEIDYVEYDSNLKNFLHKNISINHIENINAIFDDGRRFIRDTEKRYDVVILDILDPINLQLNRFYSVEFFGEVKRILNERGILLLSLPSISSVPSDAKREFLISVFNALKKQFLVVKPLEYDRTYLFSSQTDFDLEFDNLISRYRGFNISGCDFEPEIMSLALQRENNERILSILEKSDGKINSDFNPEGVFLNLILWEMMVDKKGGSLLLNYGYKALIIIAIFLTLLFAIGVRLRTNRYITSGMLMFYQGFFSMAVEFVIIYKFQIESGTLYYFMALLFSLFMGGLTAGSIFFKKIRYSISLVFLLNLLFPLLLLTNYSVATFLFLLLVLNGIVTGIIFGKLSLITMSSNEASILRTASIIDYSDCIGATVSATTISILFLPLMGIKNFLLFLLVIAIGLTFLSYLTDMSE